MGRMQVISHSLNFGEEGVFGDEGFSGVVFGEEDFVGKAQGSLISLFDLSDAKVLMKNGISG